MKINFTELKKQHSLSHALLSIPIFFIVLSIVVYLPTLVAAALINSICWFSREFAQSARPSNPFKVNWTWTNTRNFAIPTVAGFLIALVLFLI